MEDTRMNFRTDKNPDIGPESISDYAEYVAASIKEADTRADSGKMKYYTSDQIRSKLEEVLSVK